MQKKSFFHLIPRLSHNATISLSLAAVSFVIYLSVKTIGSGDTVPASFFPIVLLTEGRIYFDSYEQHYKDTGNPVYFFCSYKTRIGVELFACHWFVSHTHLLVVWHH
jgi:hypothetical protein